MAKINHSKSFKYYSTVNRIMGYENLRTQGKLVEISQPTLLERVSSPDVVYPEQFYVTRVSIRQDSGSHSTEIFGVVPSNYLGADVELLQSFYDLPNQKLFMQELYVDGRRVINQAVVKKK